MMCVLIEVVVNGKFDQLIGLKENVIVGCFILVGIGGMLDWFKCVVVECDDVIFVEWVLVVEQDLFQLFVFEEVFVENVEGEFFQEVVE